MRDNLRTVAEVIAAVLISPLVGLYRLRIVGFDSSGTALAVVPGHLGLFLRRAWYAATLEQCGRDLSVQFGSVIANPAVHVGNDVFVGHFSRIGLSSIGSDVMIGEHTSIISGGGQYGFMRRDIPMRMQPGAHTRITIGDDIWVGAGSVISSDVASHSIVSAGSVVNQRYEEWEILSGVPAQPVAVRPARRPRRDRQQSSQSAGNAGEANA